MTTTSKLTALAAGALALSAAGAVQAQTPYTAYSAQSRDVPASCRNVEQLANGYVSAECQTSGGWRWSSIRTVDCRGAVSNRDGVLTCTGARATVGPLYPDQPAYEPGQTPYGTGQQPGGIVGALLGAVFGNAFGTDQQVEDDYQQGRRPLGERRAALEARIDAGVRDGSLSRAEAARLRADYDDLVRLETRYASDGRITQAERTDLRTRYRALSQQVGDDRNDDQDYDDWRPLSEQRASFDARVDAGVRSRTLTRTQATRLKADFQALVQVETGYSRNGVDARERQDLETRLADLNRRVGDDYDGGPGSGGGYGDDYGRRITDIEARIASGERSGAIVRAEGERLRTELGDLTRLEAAYRDSGFNADERAYLTRRFGELDARARDTRR